VEETFGCSVPDEKLPELRTLADVANYVLRERQLQRTTRDVRGGPLLGAEREAQTREEQT
jgi:hypothetical protein